MHRTINQFRIGLHNCLKTGLANVVSLDTCASIPVRMKCQIIRPARKKTMQFLIKLMFDCLIYYIEVMINL